MKSGNESFTMTKSYGHTSTHLDTAKEMRNRVFDHG